MRRTAGVALLALVVGAPLVVRAVADDAVAGVPSGTTEQPTTADSVPPPGPPPVPPVEPRPDPTTPPTTTLADDTDTEAEPVTPASSSAEDDADSEAGTTTPNTFDETIEAPEEPSVDQAAEPVPDVRARLTDQYAWEEESLRVAALQQVLEVAVTGRYDAGTRSAHLDFLSFFALETDGVPIVTPPGPSARQWAALRDCESGGDYSIASSSGRYRGAYQFARSTWDSVAERNYPWLVGVDPATASAAEQDAMAYALYREAGPGPWPVCGRHLS